MKLESLRISLQDYGVNKGRYVGQCAFKNEMGGVDIVLHPDVSDTILKLCADALVQNTREMAQTMTTQIIEQSGVPALGNNSND